MIEKQIVFKHLIESMQEGLIFIDENETLAYYNHSVLNLLSPNIKSLIGKNIFSCHMLEKEDEVKKIIKKFKSGQRTPIQHTRRVGKKYYEDRIYPVCNPEGKYMGLLFLIQDVTKRKKLEEEIRALAIKDGLTGLFNLRHFYEQLKREIARFKRDKAYNISLIFFDIDNFKQYNDLYGHKEGDAILQTVAEIAAKVTRSNIDSVFRYGGDEFAVILPDTAQTAAVFVAERLRHTYAQKDVNNTSLSIGVISYDKTMDIDTFITRADQSMYAAKFAGGNRVQLYHTGLARPKQPMQSAIKKAKNTNNTSPEK